MRKSLLLVLLSGSMMTMNAASWGYLGKKQIKKEISENFVPILYPALDTSIVSPPKAMTLRSDAPELLLDKVSYLYDNNLTQEERFTYDGNNNIIKKEIYNILTGTVVYRLSRNFEQGKLVSEIESRLGSDNNLQDANKILYVYNNDGLLQTKKTGNYNSENQLVDLYTIDYTYDNLKRVVLEEWRIADVLKDSYSYTYFGNTTTILTCIQKRETQIGGNIKYEGITTTYNSDGRRRSLVSILYNDAALTNIFARGLKTEIEYDDNNQLVIRYIYSNWEEGSNGYQKRNKVVTKTDGKPVYQLPYRYESNQWVLDEVHTYTEYLYFEDKTKRGKKEYNIYKIEDGVVYWDWRMTVQTITPLLKMEEETLCQAQKEALSYVKRYEFFDNGKMKKYERKNFWNGEMTSSEFELYDESGNQLEWEYVSGNDYSEKSIMENYVYTHYMGYMPALETYYKYNKTTNTFEPKEKLVATVDNNGKITSVKGFSYINNQWEETEFYTITNLAANKYKIESSSKNDNGVLVVDYRTTITYDPVNYKPISISEEYNGNETGTGDPMWELEGDSNFEYNADGTVTVSASWDYPRNFNFIDPAIRPPFNMIDNSNITSVQMNGKEKKTYDRLFGNLISEAIYIKTSDETWFKIREEFGMKPNVDDYFYFDFVPQVVYDYNIVPDLGRIVADINGDALLTPDEISYEEVKTQSFFMDETDAKYAEFVTYKDANLTNNRWYIKTGRVEPYTTFVTPEGNRIEYGASTNNTSDGETAYMIKNKYVDNTLNYLSESENRRYNIVGTNLNIKSDRIEYTYRNPSSVSIVKGDVSLIMYNDAASIIQYNGNITSGLSYTIFDIATGKEMMKGAVVEPLISTSSLANGSYVIQIGNESLKFVK